MLLMVALALLASEEVKPSILAKGTRQLSTVELNAKLVGAEVELVVPPEMRWLHPGEYFYKDGKYVLYDHQEKSTGSYQVRDNAVCTKVDGEPEECRFIFADADGLFWIGTNKIYADQFRQIRFKEIKNRESLPSSAAPQALDRALAGAELRNAVSGKFIKLAFPPEMKLPVYPERFNRDGTYVSYGDNEEQVGRYWFKGNRFCVVAEHTERHCRYLFLGSDGRYWISATKNPSDLAPATVKPIR